MHIKVAQKDLEHAAVAVSNLVDRSAGPLPVLSNLLIEADGQKVSFRGTDIEALVIVNLEATVERPGRTTIPADTFKDIVKLLPPQAEVSIEETDSHVLISSDTNQYNLQTLPADEFPDWPSETGETKFQISQRMLKDLIDITSYALPQKDHRRVLLGVNFELANHVLQMTATDGKKLSRVKAELPEVEGSREAQIVVPKKILDNVSRVLGQDGPVEIEIAARQIVFRLQNMIYRCNGIEGKYPDCEAVIPKEFPNSVMLNRDVFLQGARRAGIVTDDKSKSIILKFEDNTCHFESRAHDLGTFNGKINLDYNGPTIEMAFNYQFLIETLSRFPKPEIKMKIKSSTAPVVFHQDEQEHRLALLMPIKLTDIRPPAAPVGGVEDA